MQSFNLEYIIAKNDLNKDFLAADLFQNNKYPRIALERVLAGKSNLDTMQLDILAKILGLHVSELFQETTWNRLDHVDKIVFARRNCRVELNLKTLIADVYKDDSLLVVESVICDKSIMLTEFLKTVNNLVNII